MILALSLLVLGILADDHDTTMSLDDLALFADLLNGWFYFHCVHHAFLTGYVSFADGELI